MRHLLGLTAILALSTPALAQPVYAPDAPPAASEHQAIRDSHIAHHDRKVARRAARHGNYAKAAAASNAANSASDASAANAAAAGAPYPR